MAKVRVISNPYRVGRVGSDSFYIVKGVQVVRPSRNVTNYGETARRSEAQQERRVKWSNLVSFYKVSKLFMNRAFETKAANQSDYNKFMSVNLARTQVSLTKELANQGACVVEPLRVSLGTLTSLQLAAGGPGLRLGLGYGYPLAMTDTVATFSEGLIDSNNFIIEGMQLSLISYSQTMVDEVPRVEMVARELTISLSDTRTLAEVLPGIELVVDNSILFQVREQNFNGGMVAILSYSADGKGIRVSTQDIIMVGSQNIYNEFTSADNAAGARESYGEDGTFFLESGDMPTT